MRHAGHGIVRSVALLAAVAVAIAPNVSAQSSGSTNAAAAAAKASPDLVMELSKELASTPEQAAGAAGALFGAAKTTMKPDDFSQVSKAVPGMDLLLKAAPSMAATGGASAAGLAQLAGTAAGLPAVASAFKKLHLKPELVSKAVPVVVGYVTKTGGAGLGNLLAGALK